DALLRALHVPVVRLAAEDLGERAVLDRRARALEEPRHALRTQFFREGHVASPEWSGLNYRTDRSLPNGHTTARTMPTSAPRGTGPNLSSRLSVLISGLSPRRNSASGGIGRAPAVVSDGQA